MAKKKAKKAKKVMKKAAKKKTAHKPAKKKSAPKKKAVKKTTAKKPAPVVEKPSTSANVYLTFPGNCEEAFNFYRSVFGGNFPYVGRFGEMPPAEGQPPVPESEKNKIMHMSLPIGKHSVIMGSDSSDAFGHATVTGNNFSISVNAVSDAEADHIFNELAEGGHVSMPLSKTFWGSYFGMLKDKYGIHWMVSHETPKK